MLISQSGFFMDHGPSRESGQDVSMILRGVSGGLRRFSRGWRIRAVWAFIIFRVLHGSRNDPSGGSGQGVSKSLEANRVCWSEGFRISRGSGIRNVWEFVVFRVLHESRPVPRVRLGGF